MDNIVTQSEIVSNVITNLIEDSVKNAWEKTRVFFKNLKDTEAIRYKTAYETYLINTRRKNSQIKTIIYRRAPKDLYSFYECIGVRYNGKIINTEKITNLFSVGNKIIVSGTGGIGKSILFKHLFLNTIEETSFIPVLIELRSFNILDTKDISLYDGIYKSLVDNGFELDKECFEYSMKEGAYIILFDGYDEVNRDKTEKITDEIKKISEKYNNNKYFVSSRPTEEFIGWNDFCEVETLELSKEQALSLIKKIDFDETVKEVFCKELDARLYDSYRSFASNPLLLNIMLLTFQKHAVIPERLNDFYEEAFVTLFNAHDATKDAYVRDIRCGLGCEEFKHIFAYICFKSYFNGEFEFSETKLLEYINQAKDKLGKNTFGTDDYQEDLTHSVCMLIKEGLVYRFAHRSFQEYFAAWYTCKLTDDIQAKLLHNWIKESDSVISDAYFQMLYDLQGTKVNKIILCPIIKDIKKIYEKSGFSICFLKQLFNNVTIRKRNRKSNQEYYSFSLGIKNYYFCRGMLLVTKLNKFPYPEFPCREEEKKVYEKVKEYYQKNDDEDRHRSNYYELSIDDILKIVSEEELLSSVKWFKEQLYFAFDILKKYEMENALRKKKVASILEEL